MTKSYLNGRYLLLRQIGAGRIGRVYEAQDHLTGAKVALKQINAPLETLTIGREDRPGSQPELTLAREFEIQARLRHPNIAPVYDFGFDAEQQPYFTMLLIQQAQHLTDYAAGLGQSDKLRLLLDLLQALAYLHRHDIVHRDLKPQNVLVDLKGRVRVVDFGLSERAANAAGVVGTLAYIAPEVIQQSAATAASDLYSVGVMVYAMFAGRLPFDSASVGRLTVQILSKQPDASALNLPPELASLVMRLLEKNPLNRYQTAEHVISALYKALDQEAPAETLEVRRSNLHYARFVGRKPEMRRLLAALDDARLGEGTGWLLTAPSGVGKSRLMAELSIYALVRGFRVLAGYGGAGQDTPHAILADVLRGLALVVPIYPAEAQALCAIVPDLGDLLGQQIAPEAETDPRQAQERLFEIVRRVILRHEGPLLLLLDDLQLAPESLALVDSLARLAVDHEMVIVGAVQSDAAPYLYGAVPHLTSMPLAPLAGDEVAQLAQAVLGAAALSPDMLARLQDYAEGSAFYLIDALQHLADLAGGLGAVRTLPPDALDISPTVVDVARRRLAYLPDAMHELTLLAAAAGAQLDLALLEHLFGQDVVDAWLIAAVNTGVLHVNRENWRFAHGRLRDGLVALQADKDRRRRHTIIAEALQALYGDAALGRIADHWLQAGEVLRAAEAGIAHAESLYRTGELQAALSTLDRYAPEAIALPPRLRFEALLRCAAIERVMGQLMPARQNLDRAAALLDDTVIPTSLHINLFVERARQAVDSGQLNEADESIQHLLPLAQQHGDPDLLVMVLNQAAVVAIAHADYETAHAWLDEVISLARQHGNQQAIAAGLYNRARILSIHQHRSDEAVPFITEALALAEAVDNRLTIVRSLSLSYVVRIKLGDVEAAEAHAERALRLAHEIGAVNQETVIIGNLAWWYAERGQYEASAAHYEQVIAIDRVGQFLPNLVGRLGAVAQVYVLLGRWDRVRASLKEWLTTAVGINQVRQYLHGLYAWADLALHEGQPALAAQMVGWIRAFADERHLVEDELAPIEQRIVDCIGAAALAAAVEAARHQDFDAVVADLLHHAQALDDLPG